MDNSLLYRYDVKSANFAVNWIEKFCSHAKGELGGKPFKLEKWQKDEIIKPLFGWKRKKDGLRKYNRCAVFVPRKNGKSTLGSAIALYMLCADGEKGAEIYSAASDRTQAGIIHEVAKTMVNQHPELRKRVQVYQNSIVYEKTASFYKAISSDVKTKHGFNAHAIIFDELHAQPNRELWDVLTTSIGARTQPIVIIFTTAGFDKKSICYHQYEYAKKVKAGIIHDDTFLPVIYESDELDSIMDESIWKKANPNYGISLKQQYVRDEALRAQNEPGYENTFRRLQLNQWTSSDVRWITDTTWMACNQVPDLAKLEGKACYAGLDLASKRDITSFVLMFEPDEHGNFNVLPFFFIPELNAIERVTKDNVPYDQWIRQGLIIETPGDVTDYDFIQAYIIDLHKKFNIKSIAYDRWNSSQCIINLQKENFNCTPFGQGFASMSAPTKELETYVLQKKIAHGGNAVLRWMASNVMLQIDAADNKKIHKGKSTEKVDGMVALVMALGEYMTHKKEIVSPYTVRGVRTL